MKDMQSCPPIARPYGGFMACGSETDWSLLDYRQSYSLLSEPLQLACNQKLKKIIVVAGKAWKIKLVNFQLVAFTLQRNNMMSIKIFAGLSHRRAPKKKLKKTRQWHWTPIHNTIYIFMNMLFFFFFLWKLVTHFQDVLKCDFWQNKRCIFITIVY